MPVVWLFIGSAMVAFSYYFFYTPTDPWPGVIGGAIGGTIFLVVLFFGIMKTTPFSLKTKIASTVLLLAVLGLSEVSWKTLYDMSHYQRKILGTIRIVIGEGILQSYTEGAMIPPFHAYYATNQRKKIPIGKLFLVMNKDKIHGGSYKFENDLEQVSMLRNVSDTSITLIMVDTVARGRDAAFKNANGQTGRLQAKATLTERGVSHEREN